MSTVAKLWLALIVFVGVPMSFFLWKPTDTLALNVASYRDTISDSGPNELSNHTFEFTLDANLSPGSQLEFTPPDGFEISSSTEYFDAKNVELIVNGFPRTASTTASPGVDLVEIISGSPGLIRYTLAPGFSILAGSSIKFRIGNQTTNGLPFRYSYSTSTNSTTTFPGDIEPIRNSQTLGLHQFHFEAWDGGTLEASAGFVIFLIDKVRVPNVNTRETIPPYRFNGAPTSTVGGTTLNVEISLETDEFSICRFSRTPGVAFGAMTTTFTNTGLIYHSSVVAVTANTLEQFYVRCIDDEGNFNIDDFLIEFRVNPAPTGTSNQTGSTSGDGTGSGNTGTGNGSGGGGSTGGSNGQEPLTGGSAGTGGSGGGGGGGSGGSNGGGSGGNNDSGGTGYPSGDARVVITGLAFPNSSVSILVDGKSAVSARANSTGAYSATIDAIYKGVYTFGIYATGGDGVKSSTFSTSFTVSGGRTSELTNINVPPSVSVTPNPVNIGQTLTVSGYALPNAVITLQNGPAKTTGKEKTANSDSSGRWSATFDTASFSNGDYRVRAKAAQATGANTNYSAYTIYGVGGAASTGSLNADLNRDGKVNLIDFSILLYWWNSNGGNSDPSADINSDGKVNLTDFSIQLFNWTG